MRRTLLAAFVAAATLPALPAEARKEAPLPAGITRLEPDRGATAPKSATLLVAVLSYGKQATYQLTVSPFPKAKPLPPRPKSAPPRGAAEEVAEADWRAELDAAQKAGLPKPDMAGGGPMGKKQKKPKVGAKETFYVTQRKGAQDGDVPVTLKLASAHANWWVDDALKVDMKLLTRASKTFETKTYKRVRKVFGKEVKNVAGGDTRLNFVVSALNGVGGYFAASGLWPTSKPRAGSGRKVLLISSSWLQAQGLDGIVAHEFQHLVNFSRKCVPSEFQKYEASWVDEGFGELAVDVAGRGAKSTDTGSVWRAGTWLANTSALPLEVSITAAKDRNAAYGRSYLFARYLADRFGEGIVEDVMAQPEVGRAGIGAALGKHGETFDGVWRDWTAALASAGGMTYADPRFSYKSLDLSKTPLVPTDSVTPEASGSLPPYTVRFHRFRAAKPQAWTIKLTGEAGGVAMVAPGR